MERTSVEEIMEKDFLKIGADDRVSKLLGLLNAAKKYHAVVFDSSDAYLGITSTSGLLRRQADLSQMKVRSVTDENRPMLSREMSLMKAAELMYVSDSRVLPVVENGNVYGVVSADALIREAAERSPIASSKARDMASSALVVLKQDESLGKAVSLMKERNIKRILIVDKTGKVSGTLSLRNLMEKYLAQSTGGRIASLGDAHGHSTERDSALSIPVSSEMSTSFKTIEPDKKIGPVLSDIENGYSIVLAEKGKPVGIITRRDLLEAIVKTGAVERNIQTANMPALDEIDLARVNSTINAAYDRVKKSLNTTYCLLVHFKQYKQEGGKTKHSIHIHASGPGMNFKAESYAWNVLTALQDALGELEREIRKGIGKKTKSSKKARAK
jgi:predicted transcriptional regulator/ribosome-associated translation inhibitor RaiA